MKEIDEAIYTQLVIARLGEKEIMNWWNTDIAYEHGGAAFLQRLLGEKMSILAAIEGLLKAAMNKELSLLEKIPNYKKYHSLFYPEHKLQIMINERLRHFKRYPEETPDEILEIMNPEKDYSEIELKNMITKNKNKALGTSFGKEFKIANLPIIDKFNILANGIIENQKSGYKLSYYQGIDSELA